MMIIERMKQPQEWMEKLQEWTKLKLMKPKVTKITEMSRRKTTRRQSHVLLVQWACENSHKRIYANKSLQNQSHKEYEVFNIIEETESDEGVMVLQIDQGNVDIFDAEKPQQMSTMRGWMKHTSI